MGQYLDKAPEDELLEELEELLEELEELLELELLEVRPLEELELLDEELEEELEELEEELELLDESLPVHAVNKNAPNKLRQRPVICFLMVILLSRLMILMVAFV